MRQHGTKREKERERALGHVVGRDFDFGGQDRTGNKTAAGSKYGMLKKSGGWRQKEKGGRADGY